MLAINVSIPTLTDVQKSGKGKHKKLECGPMPNVMAALPNSGGASVKCRKVWLTHTSLLECRAVALTRHETC